MRNSNSICPERALMHVRTPERPDMHHCNVCLKGNAELKQHMPGKRTDACADA